MDVEIGEIASTVSTFDGGSPPPEVMDHFVRRALLAFKEERARDARVRAERRITDGVSAERDSEIA